MLLVADPDKITNLPKIRDLPMRTAQNCLSTRSSLGRYSLDLTFQPLRRTSRSPLLFLNPRPCRMRSQSSPRHTQTLNSSTSLQHPGCPRRLVHLNSCFNECLIAAKSPLHVANPAVERKTSAKLLKYCERVGVRKKSEKHEKQERILRIQTKLNQQT